MDSINKLLDNCLEIEGLLSLLASGRSSVDSSIHTLLKQKALQLLEDISHIKPNAAMTIQIETQAETTRKPKIDVITEQEETAVNDSQPTIVRNDIIPVELTINDKFRFIKELFGGSQTDLDETLHVISTMSTLAEIQSYLYDDLCMDPNNESVEYFISVVSSKVVK